MKKKNVLGEPTTRKATPEEVAKYNGFLNKESNRLNQYRALNIANNILHCGAYSTTAQGQ